MATTANHELRHSTPKEVWGVACVPHVGAYVILDHKNIGELLMPGDPEPVGDGWPGCDFRFPNPIFEWREKHAIACNVHVTGRTLQLRDSCSFVRVKVEWVGDCEPSTYCGGWMKVR